MRWGGYGYVLTQAGIDLASQCEPVFFDDWLIFRSGMFFDAYKSSDPYFFSINDWLKDGRITLSELPAAIKKAKLSNDCWLARGVEKLLSVTL